MRVLAVCVAAAVTLAAATAAYAAPPPTLSDIEDEVMCPICGTALSLSESPLAQRQRAFIQRLIDRGRSKAEIKARLVEEFGPEVLAKPSRSGFLLSAYLVPLVVLAVVLALVALALMRRGRAGPGRDPAPPGDRFEELVDADLSARGGY